MTPGERYRQLCQRVAEHAKGCGRDPGEITLICVSKGRSVSEIQSVYEAGCRHFGENRVDEALDKQSQLPSDIGWHFIGTLQRKKVPKVIGRFALIHSVDTLELAQAISKRSGDKGLTTPILLEVNTSGEAAKHGFSPDEIHAQFVDISALDSIRVDGLMTMAPLTDDQPLIRSTFAQLKELRTVFSLRELSMGMTHDWPTAIECGATLLRIGSAIFQAT